MSFIEEFLKSAKTSQLLPKKDLARLNKKLNDSFKSTLDHILRHNDSVLENMLRQRDQAKERLGDAWFIQKEIPSKETLLRQENELCIKLCKNLLSTIQ